MVVFCGCWTVLADEVEVLEAVLNWPEHFCPIAGVWSIVLEQFVGGIVDL